MIFTGSRGDGYTGERQERKPHSFFWGLGQMNSWATDFYGDRRASHCELQEWVQGEDRYLQGKNAPKWAVWGSPQEGG